LISEASIGLMVRSARRARLDHASQAWLTCAQ